MGMPETLERWTAARVRDLPDDGKRYEVVDGELFVTPAPTFDHQRAVGELYVLLRAHCQSTGCGEAVTSPADVEFDPRTLVQPDVFVVPIGAGRPKRWSDIRSLLLAAENPLALHCESRPDGEATPLSARRRAGILDL